MLYESVSALPVDSPGGTPAGEDLAESHHEATDGRRYRRRLKIGVLGVATLLLGGLGLTLLPNASASTTADIAGLANDNIGKKACSTNSLGGDSYGSSCTGNGGQPEYWCADFAKWVWSHENVDHTGTLTAAAHSFYVYGQDYDTFTKKPAVGDAAVFSHSTSPDDIHHVAIVTKVSAGKIQVVSGDWGGESGTQAHFASTSHVVKNPEMTDTTGEKKAAMNMYLIGFVKPVGVAAPTGPRNSGAAVFDGGDTHLYGIKASSGGVYEDKYTTKWSGWKRQTGTGTGTPAVTRHGSTEDVFVVSPNGNMHQRTYSGGKWSGWKNLGGKFGAGTGVAAIWENGEQHVFGITHAGTLFENTYTTKWSGWKKLGGTVQGTPAVTYHDGRFDVFATSPANGAMYHKIYNGKTWGPWASLGGVFGAGNGAGAVYEGGRYHVFGITHAGTAFEKTFNSKWGDWKTIGGTVTGTPAVTTHGGSIDLYAQNPNNHHFYQKHNNGTSWSAWKSLGGDFS
jgi:hypothetical protein